MTTGEELESLRPTWNRIEARASELNPFLSWDWQWAWWRSFGAGRQLRCLVVYADSEPLGVAPMFSEAAHPERLLPLGSGELSDHLGLLLVAGSGPRVAPAVLSHLLAGAGWAAAEFHHLPDASEALSSLVAAVGGLPLAHQLGQDAVSPKVELAASFDEFVGERLGKKDRHELRRKLRRMDTEAPGWRCVDDREIGLEPALDHFLRLLRASGPHKERFLTGPVETFIRTAARAMRERGWLRLQLLQAGDRFIAATMGLTSSGTWRLYNSGYDPEQAALSPGLVAVAMGIRVAIGEGCRGADFLRGDEPYKYHLGAVDRPLWRLQVSRDAGGERA